MTTPDPAQRHLVASAIVYDPHPAEQIPRVLLVWSRADDGFVFPTVHLWAGESLPEAPLRAARQAGRCARPAAATRPTAIRRGPSRPGQPVAHRRNHRPHPGTPQATTRQPMPPAHRPPVHLHSRLRHTPATTEPGRARWWPLVGLPHFTDRDIPPPAYAAAYPAGAITYLPPTTPTSTEEATDD